MSVNRGEPVQMAQLIGVQFGKDNRRRETTVESPNPNSVDWIAKRRFFYLETLTKRKKNHSINELQAH